MQTIAHVLYSGLGGHQAELFGMVAADQSHPEHPNRFRQVALFLGTDPLAEANRRECERLGIPYTYVHKQQGLRPGYLLRIYRELARLRPDAVVLHGLVSLPAAWWYCRRRGIPLIALETQANHLKSRAERVLSRLAQQLTDRVLVLTAEYARELQHMLGSAYRAARVQVLPNGIDTNLYHPAPVPHHPANGTVHIGMISRVVPNKDHDTLLRAFARLCQQPGLPPLQLHVAGDGERLTHVQSLAAQLGIAAHVRFHGALGRSASAEFLQGLDLYVQVTFGESFCFSVMEALATGLPVLTDDVPVLNQILRDLPYVRFFPNQDDAALAAALHQWIAQPGEVAQLRAAARAYAVQHLSHYRMLDRYAELIAELSRNKQSA